MSIQFSVESVEYLAEKLNNGQFLCSESIVYLVSKVSEVIYNILQDASKVLIKCHRNQMTPDDFEFALKLRRLTPLYGHRTRSNHPIFYKIKKDNRILYQLNENVVSFDQIITNQVKVPFDINIHVHWLAINGKQPRTNENPSVNSSKSSILQKPENKFSHLLSREQQLYYKELTQMCICLNETQRKQALLILSSDHNLQQIISHLIIFIWEGVRVNLSPTSTFDRSIVLKFLMEMCDALLQNEALILEPYLHYLLPAILSCLLERRISRDHWGLRDFAAKCCGQLIRKCSSPLNRLQQRTVDLFYRILTNNEYSWSTQYGAIVGLCEMSHKVIIQIVFPIIKPLGEKIRMISDKEILQKLTDVIVKLITMAYHSIQNENQQQDLYKDFGSYFAPLIQRQLILLL